MVHQWMSFNPETPLQFPVVGGTSYSAIHFTWSGLFISPQLGAVSFDGEVWAESDGYGR
jgi:hypothetical protein